MRGKPQIKLAAVKVGDLLKSSTSTNIINRIATSVFTFSCEHFLIEGITSQRAKLIFDWLMTLFKQNIHDDEKLDLTKKFLTNISPKDMYAQIIQVLVETNIMEVEETDTRTTPSVEAVSEAKLLKHVFKPEVFSQLPVDTTLSAALIDRFHEAQACIEVRAYLAATILCGSVLEGMCLGFGYRHPERVNRAYSTRYNKSPKEFHEWKLWEWIDVLGHLKDLSPNVEEFGHALRNFRNYIHPAEQLANGFSPDQHTARIGFQVVIAAAEDLVRAEAALSKEAKL
jgi:hypothetical protein